MQAPPPSTFRILLIAAYLGVACGVAEAIVYTVLSLVPDWLGWRNDLLPQIVWIAPLCNLLLFLGLGAVVALLARVCQIERPDVFTYALFGWLASYGPLAASEKLHPIACVLLATGVAVQLYRYARARPPAAALRLGARLAVCLLLVPLLAVALPLHRSTSIQGTGVSGQAAARPNVLLITLDTLRADHVSAYGYPRPTTPNIDRMAGEGVLFANAFSTASWTLPSHASIMTGRYSYEHRADGRPLDQRYPTLAEVLSAHGYATAAFVANVHYVTPRAGLERGFHHFEAYYSSPTDMARRTFYGRKLFDRLPWLGYYDIPGRKRATEVNREFLQWLEANPRVPFFAFLNYFDVHDPYVPPRGYETRFSPSVNRGSRINSELIPDLFRPANTKNLGLSEGEIQLEIDGYDASLAYLDAQLGALFSRLTELGVIDQTLIIITSDHGESFGEHGLYGHGNGLYRNLIHVPLVIRYPANIPASRRVANVVSLVGVPATVMRVLGIEEDDTPFPGHPLNDYWTSQAATISDDASEGAFAESLPEIRSSRDGGAVKSLSTSQWHLIVHAKGQIELFQVDRDVHELQDLADSAGAGKTIGTLGAGMERLMTPKEWQLFGGILAKRTSH